MKTRVQLERRTYPRYRIKADTQIQTSDSYLNVNTIELSVEGIRIEAYAEIKPGTAVAVTFDSIKKLVFRGKTVWILAIQRGDYMIFQMGIKIDAILLSGVRVTGFNQKDELIQDILMELKQPD